jgi:P27 family predicted phage terminase small subunit
MGARGPISNRVKGVPARGHRTKAQIAGAVTAAPPVRPPAPPRVPSGLGVEGRAAWTAAFVSPWLGSGADLGLVRIFADLFDERAELRALIAEGGRIATGSKGQPVSAPAVEQLRQVEAGIARMAMALGLGPANAARLGVRLTLERERGSERPGLALVQKYAEDLA